MFENKEWGRTVLRRCWISCVRVCRLLWICWTLSCTDRSRASVWSTPTLLSAFRAFHLPRAPPSETHGWVLSVCIDSSEALIVLKLTSYDHIV